MRSKINFKLPKLEYLPRWFDKYKYPMLICLVGLVLILWPNDTTKPEEKKMVEITGVEEQTKELEAKMEALFSSMSGVGKVRVMLTVKSGQETIYAYDTDCSTTRREDEQNQTVKSELIVVGSGSGESPVVTKVQMPEFLGAVVVCEGADSAKVCLQLTEAVQSLTGITADNIVISKMQK